MADDQSAELFRLRELFVREYPRMVKLAGLLGAADAENVAQEAFVRLNSHFGRLRDSSAATAYLRATLVNLVRTDGARRATMLRILTSRGTWLTRPGCEVSAEEEALRAVPRSAVASALQHLPMRQREAIVLRYWLDLSMEDTAATMGVPLGTAKSHLSRALTQLRRVVVEDGEEPRG